ncbi:Npun_F5749 family FMN-dependent PPOX-type flavoprotein [Oscillatoria sp. FACHB-1406]|uniref:Npun_F5749 family FMN-dependent PPOX-type flavoprotein n=1 Tax=Oscillatoria sp. FACHB-1406 TaxID=2692846 RepID=UPI001683F146|nr:Npun_F5749 family FMN-dependent PPOX-type flavoprotein [Oscillatoria sp. FACHB-1406]MBD2579455.1 pyridoxamine 5'-phosphate oxidase family protein [Oscillatoria sp. FACHB-1406]
MQPLAPWRSRLTETLHLNRSLPNSRYFQLATVSPSGEPKNRTVVFRGFLENSNAIAIATDLRSEKIAQIQTRSRGEICWYFPQTREQFRLSGVLTLIDSDGADARFQQERQNIWRSLSDAARVQFTWPSPAEPRNKNPLAFDSSAPNAEQPLDNFCLLLLDCDRADYLQLSGNPHNRWLYQRNPDSSWTTLEVNP